MSTLHNKYDTIENLIFEEGLRIKSLEINQEKDKMIIHLSNDVKFITSITHYKGLKKATNKKLLHFKFIGSGTGISWPDLDEDLSLKGFLKEFLLQTVKNKKELVIS
jgi:Protein of unknown function (DUF2442)